MKFFIKILNFLAVAALAVFLLRISVSNGSITAVCGQGNYQAKESILVTIENKSLESVCFSSCYPYLMEKKIQGGWEQYRYGRCDFEDIPKDCLAPNGRKKFVLALGEAESGLNRLMIPLCKGGCGSGRKFESDMVIYSNNFEIK